MEGGKKRKRVDDDITVLTFYAPGNRVFDRVFKDKSLEALKAGVRKKLGLSSETDVSLSQLRNGKRIDLEDDDDFDALRARSSVTDAMDISVAIGHGTDFVDLPVAENRAASAPSDLSTPKRKKRKIKAQTPAIEVDRPGKAPAVDAIQDRTRDHRPVVDRLIAGISDDQQPRGKGKTKRVSWSEKPSVVSASYLPATPMKDKQKQSAVPSPSILKTTKYATSTHESPLTADAGHTPRKEMSLPGPSPNLANQVAERTSRQNHSMSLQPKASSSKLPNAESTPVESQTKKKKKKRASAEEESSLGTEETQKAQASDSLPAEATAVKPPKRTHKRSRDDTPESPHHEAEPEVQPLQEAALGMDAVRPPKKQKKGRGGILEPSPPNDAGAPDEPPKHKSKSKAGVVNGLEIPSTQAFVTEPPVAVPSSADARLTSPEIPLTQEGPSPEPKKKKKKSKSSETITESSEPTSPLYAGAATATETIDDSSNIKSKRKKKAQHVDSQGGQVESVISGKDAETSVVDTIKSSKKNKNSKATSTATAASVSEHASKLDHAAFAATVRAAVDIVLRRSTSASSHVHKASDPTVSQILTANASAARPQARPTDSSPSISASLEHTDASNPTLTIQPEGLAAPLGTQSATTTLPAKTLQTPVSDNTNSQAKAADLKQHAQSVPTLAIVREAVDKVLGVRQPISSDTDKSLGTSASYIPAMDVTTEPPQVRSSDKGDNAHVKDSIVADSASSGSRQALSAAKEANRISCPVCGGTPFHLRFLCPIIQAGSDAFKKRISELKANNANEDLIADLEDSLARLRQKESQTDRISSVLNGAADKGAESISVARSVAPTVSTKMPLPESYESISAARVSSQPRTTISLSGSFDADVRSTRTISTPPVIPAGSVISEVTVESQGEGSSDEDDSATESESEEGSPVDSKTTPPTLLSSALRTVNASTSLDDIDLEALLRGPPRSSRQILDEFEKEENKDEEDDKTEPEEDVELEEEKNELAFRRLSKRFEKEDSSSENDPDGDSSAASEAPAALSQTDGTVPLPNQQIGISNSTSMDSSERAVEEIVGGEQSVEPAFSAESHGKSATNVQGPEENSTIESLEKSNHTLPKPIPLPEDTMNATGQATEPGIITASNVSVDEDSSLGHTRSAGPPSSPLPISNIRDARSSDPIEVEPLIDPALLRISSQEDPADPIEPADDLLPTHFIVESDPIEPEPEDLLVRITPPPTSSAKVGTAKRMRDRRGKIPGNESELPILTSDIVAESTPAAARSTRVKKAATTAHQEPTDKPAEKPASKVTKKPASKAAPKSTSKVTNGAPSASKKPSSAALMPPPPVAAVTKTTAAPAPAPKRRGRPPISPEERARREAEKQAEKDRKAAERAAAKEARDAARQTVKEQKASSRTTRGRKSSAQTAEAVEAPSLESKEESPTAVPEPAGGEIERAEQPPSGAPQPSEATHDGEASQLSTVEWTTLTQLPASLPETDQVDELRSSSPPHLNGAPSSPAVLSATPTLRKGTLSLNGSFLGSTPRGSQATSSQRTDQLKTPHVDHGRGLDDDDSRNPLFLPGSQSQFLDQSQLMIDDSSIEIPGSSQVRGRSELPSSDEGDMSLLNLLRRQQPSRAQTETPGAVKRSSAWTANAKYRRLSDLASQQLFPTPKPAILDSSQRAKGTIGTEYKDDEDDEEDESSSSEDPDRSHIPKNRRAGAASQKPKKGLLSYA